MVLLMITAVGIYFGKKVTNATDFSTSGRAAGTGIVAGSLIGTLAGGASTIGTAQLAFSYGFSAWWFTMGGGIGLIVMALSFAKPLYCSGASTIAQIFEREYGRKVAITTALLMSIGTFLSITSQLLSGISLITSVSEISSPAAAMPVFILRHLPPLWGGIILAALLAALIGTGAGLALGMSSMFCGDIIKPCCKTSLSDAVLLRVQRRIIVVILASAGLFTFGNMGSVILSWSFMSMGLRGAVAFAPLLFCLYAPGRADRRFVLSAIIAGPLVVLAGNFVLPSEIDPLFPGISVGLLLVAAGAASSPKDSMEWKN